MVIDALAEVIEWHERELIPLGKTLNADPRCRLVNGDFFAMTFSETGFDPQSPGRHFDAVLVDIDHSPRNLLHPRHAALYETDGLRRLAQHLRPGGVFALWSNDPPDEDFKSALANVFAISDAQVVTFDNPLQNRSSSNTIYTGIKARLPVGKAFAAEPIAS